MGERHELPAAGFAFRVPIGYASQIEERRAIISDLQGTLVISLAGVESTSSEEEIIDQYLDALASKSEGEFLKTPSDPVIIGRVEGKAFDLTGSLFGSPLKGKTFIIPLGSNRFFYGLAIANGSQDEQAWDDLGAEVLEAVLESVELIEPKSAGSCPISADPAYGYTEENALRVGNDSDFADGPARELACLDNLGGAHSELISDFSS